MNLLSGIGVSRTAISRRLRDCSVATALGVLFLLAPPAQAYEYTLPPDGDSVVGEVFVVPARAGDTLLDIARRHKVGYEEIRLANPKVDTWLPGEGTKVTIPKRFVLPDAPRTGIVVNIPEMRLYYYPEPVPGQPARVLTYPVSVGRGDWQTPLGDTRIVRKDQNPAWRPPESIRAEHAARGDYLPEYVPPGPGNPLGEFALRLALPGYLIHGTNKPWGIGMQVTHGCLRLYPEDIDSLFRSVSVGTPVHLVSQATKVGWREGQLYLEVHPAFDKPDVAETTSLTPLVRAVLSAKGRPPSSRDVDWDFVYATAQRASGIPVRVSRASTVSRQSIRKLGDAD
jgi:L,D-transpeptidase ErfK/SrfK